MSYNYDFKHFYEWVLTNPETDYIGSEHKNGREYCLYYSRSDMNCGEEMAYFKYVEFIEFCQRVGDMGTWHLVTIYHDLVRVSLNEDVEDDYEIDTSFFTSEVTDESYFQYCTIGVHDMLSREDFEMLVHISLILRDLKHARDQ